MSQVKFYKNTSKYLANVDKTTTQEGEVYFAKDGIGVVETSGKMPTKFAERNVRNNSRICEHFSDASAENASNCYYAPFRVYNQILPGADSLPGMDWNTDNYVSVLYRGCYVIKSYFPRIADNNSVMISTSFLNIEQDWERSTSSSAMSEMSHPLAYELLSSLHNYDVHTNDDYSLSLTGAAYTYYSTPFVAHTANDEAMLVMVKITVVLPSTAYNPSSGADPYECVADDTPLAVLDFDVVSVTDPTTSVKNRLSEFFRICRYSCNPYSPDYYKAVL